MPPPIPILSQISSQPPMQTQQIIHQTPQKIIQTTRTSFSNSKKLFSIKRI
jgi:hypothetical protein